MAYRFNWADTQQIVETADERLIERIARFLCLAAEPCGEPADIRVSGGEGAWTLDTPYGAGAASEPRDLAYLLLESLAYGFQETTRTPLAHVGAIDAGHGALVLFGSAYAGKSSLAVGAWRRGAALIGDDRVRLDAAAGSVAAFPKCAKLRLASGESANPLGGAVPEADGLVGRIRDDRRFIISRGLPGIEPYGTARPVRALVELVRRNAEPGARVAPLPLREAYDRMLPEMISPQREPLALLRLIKRLAAAGRLVRLTVGDGEIDTALDRLTELGG